LSGDGGWRWAAASIAGTSHRAAGTDCQDAHAAAVRSDGVLVAAVADGAGSAPHSARGAAVAAAAAVGTLLRDGGPAGGGSEGTRAADRDVEARRARDAERLAAALQAARAAVQVLADAEGWPVRDLACTLSCAIVRPEGVLAAQIGDGLIVAVGPDGVVTAVTMPQRGDYANETTFLTSEGAVAAALDAMTRADVDVAAVVLLTDGLLRLALDVATATPHAAFFQPLARFAAAIDDVEKATAHLAAFLDSPRVRARTDDDLTLLVAATGPAEP